MQQSDTVAAVMPNAEGYALCLAGAEKIETVQQASDLISKQIDTK